VTKSSVLLSYCTPLGPHAGKTSQCSKVAKSRESPTAFVCALQQHFKSSPCLPNASQPLNPQTNKQTNKHSFITQSHLNFKPRPFLPTTRRGVVVIQSKQHGCCILVSEYTGQDDVRLFDREIRLFEYGQRSRIDHVRAETGQLLMHC
jgi:hypothetical protein